MENVLDIMKCFLSSSSKVLQISAFPLLLYYYDIIDIYYFFVILVIPFALDFDKSLRSNPF